MSFRRDREPSLEELRFHVEWLAQLHYRAAQRYQQAYAARVTPEMARAAVESVTGGEPSPVSMHETPGVDGNMEPVKGTLWQSESGQKYYVVTLGNRCKEPGWPCSAYPRSVVFVEAGDDGKPVDQEPYVVPVSDWRSRMTPI